jgi:hypothetical protein
MNAIPHTSTLSALRGNGWGGPQESYCAFALDRRGSDSQSFFLKPQFLKTIKRNQFIQTLVFKGAARLQVDEIADLFSGRRGRVKSLADRKREPAATVPKQNCEIKYKKPNRGRVKRLGPSTMTGARVTHIFLQISGNFSAPQPHTSLQKIAAKFGGGGSRMSWDLER